MFLKISKTPHNIRCLKGKESKSLRIGTRYSFSLVESCRTGKRTGHKTIAGLGSYTVNEYEPLYRGGGVSSFGTANIQIHVKSFDLDDPASFRKVRPEVPIRFYHTFTRKIIEAASIYGTPVEKIREITGQVLAIIPLYNEEEYRAYIQDEVMDKVKQEGSGRYGKDLRKLIGQTQPYEIYDWVVLMDGQLQFYRNMLNIRIDYDFKLVV
jgi:hypothetical protein